MKFILFVLCSYSAFGNEVVVELGEKLFKDERFSRSKMVSCASCHIVDQNFNSGGMRTYNDFQKRTRLLIPIDGTETTLRNTPGLVGIGSQYSRNNFSHHDGELFHHETYMGNFTGPNMGWRNKSKATENVLKILRTQEYVEAFRSLPLTWSVDFDSLDDEQVLNEMIKVGTHYLFDLDFVTDEAGLYIGSPYDKFLAANGVERGPRAGESNLEYSARIRKDLRALKNPVYIKNEYYPNLKGSYQFEEKEFEGLKLFFNISKRAMCINCHTAPLFTDESFHNIGITQREYDSVHGDGAFRKFKVPSLRQREAKNLSFLSLVDKMDKTKVDLGVWNFYARRGHDELTRFLDYELCIPFIECNREETLTNFVASFKTPSLRLLAMSNPYFHNGSSETIEKAIEQYIDFSKLIKAGKAVNPDHRLRMIQLDKDDVLPLKAFLNALNEDYE